jgi:hypothetical protein
VDDPETARLAALNDAVRQAHAEIYSVDLLADIRKQLVDRFDLDDVLPNSRLDRSPQTRTTSTPRK